jgi:NADP-dependent 3-hydroxy acid dehydrogenase YdfG
VDTEIETHLRGEIREAIARQTQGVEKLKASDVADAIAYMVTRDRRIAVNEVLVRASAQTW